MFRLKPILLSAALLGLLSFGQTGSAFAEASTTTVGNAAPMVAPSPAQPPSATIPMATAPAALRGAEQRVALVIGNSNYQNAPKLANPGNDAQSMADLLNSAGFEVVEATDLTQNDMVKVLQDFSGKVASRGPNTVAMVYYAGHGVQLAGENYLIPVDANISTPSDLTGNSVRLVDVMGTLETIPSRMRIVVLDACRNNPFPNVNDASRGLAIVDAPNGSIVGYSTAPGMEAQDGSNGHSPYTNAFLHLAREPNLPIEQLFKRVRLEVNNSTDGRQTPWESSSLTSDFYFFGDTAVAAARAPAHGPVVQMASNLPSRSARQAYDFVLSEGSPEYYQEFITLYPYDPLCDRIRFLLSNWLQVAAWHKTVLANTPFAYKTFHDNFAGSPYAQSALKLQVQPKIVPLMQFTRLADHPVLKPTNNGLPNNGIKLGNGLGNSLGNSLGDKLPNGSDGKAIGGGKIVTLPASSLPKPQGTGKSGPLSSPPGKVVTMPAPRTTATNAAPSGSGIGKGKVVNLPVTNVGRATSNPDLKATSKPQFRVERQNVQVNKPRFGGNMAVNTSPRIGAQSMNQNQGHRGFMR